MDYSEYNRTRQSYPDTDIFYVIIRFQRQISASGPGFGELAVIRYKASAGLRILFWPKLHILTTPAVNMVLKIVGAARSPEETASLDLNRVAAAILARTVPPALSVSYENGLVSVYRRTPSLVKPGEGTSQRNKHLAVAGRDIPSAAESSVSRLPPRPTATEQVGLWFFVGLSYATFNRIWVLFVAALSPMANRQALWQARSALLKVPASDVFSLDSGAHLSNLCCAVEGRLCDLCWAGLFAERASSDP